MARQFAASVAAQRPLALGQGSRAHEELRGLCAAVLAALPTTSRRDRSTPVAPLRLRPAVG